MAGAKRKQREVEIPDNIHPARKRRVEHGSDASLAQLYNDLADEVPIVRLKAAGDLVKNLTQPSPDRDQRLDSAFTRLVKGLCSGRKAARLGFSVALCELLPLAAKVVSDGSFGLGTVTAKVVELTQPEGKTGGQEKREYLLGRRFALQATLQSGIWETSSDEEWKQLLNAISALAATKDWLGAECGAMLYEFLENAQTKLSVERVENIVNGLRARGLLQSPEGVALWLAISEHWPQALPKGIWHKKDPLCSNERPQLKKILLGSGLSQPADDSSKRQGTRQSQPSFAWKIILQSLFRREKNKDFKRFWEEIIGQGFFAASSSDERMALGFQNVSLALSIVPIDYLQFVWDGALVRSIVKRRTEFGPRYLFDAAKLPLDQLLLRAESDPAVARHALPALFAEGAFDEHIKTKTVDTLLQQLDVSSLDDVVSFLQTCILKPSADSRKQVEYRRRLYGMHLQYLVKKHRTPEELFVESSSRKDRKHEVAPWLNHTLELIVHMGYCNLEDASPPLTEDVRSAYRTRLNACLAAMLDTLSYQVLAIFDHVREILRASQKSLAQPVSEEAKEAVEEAERSLDLLSQNEQESSRAYKLLFSMLVIQAHSGEADAIEALSDLQASYQRQESDGDGSAGVVEILLSLLSQNSLLLRKFAENVFGAIAPNLTGDGFQSFFEVLLQKESLSGQQMLAAPQEDEEGEAVDVDDMLDVELVNGTEVGAGAEDSGDESESGSESGSDVSDEDGEDEESAFDRKLADALGTAGMEGDSDDDGSDMDDDQMEAVDAHLTTIFKERQKNASTKQDAGRAKKNVAEFKNRVLDLLMIYIKSQYANILTLDMLSPLLICMRTTSSKMVSEKTSKILNALFDTCSKKKALPVLQDSEAALGLLAKIHGEVKRGSSRAHAHACSRASLFLAKILTSMSEEYYRRVAHMYADLQADYDEEANPKWQGLVLTEWVSWTLSRKQK